MRNKIRFLDFSIVLLAGLAVIYAALGYDIFSNAAGHTSDAQAIEFDELLAVCATFLVGMIWAVGRLLRERRDNARRLAVEREMRRLAMHDALTGLPNRRQFDEALKEAVASPPGTGACHAVLMLDLNNFKRVNDVFGHASGDEVLMQVGHRIVRAVREKDLVARLGGDEFAVLATHVLGAEAATGLAMRIIRELEPAIRAGGGEHAIGAAIGIALVPQDGTAPNELLRKADIALYRAKAEGHSAMRFFEADMDRHVRERDQIERALRAAIENNAIVPFYQPLMDLKSGAVRGFEALARWQHGEIGEVAPERFIPVAEDTGLIAPLTDSLLDRALQDAGTWPPETELAVNISPVLLRNPGFALRILSRIERAGFAPRRLELEITESALVRDLDAARATLGMLHDAGVRIALDDFGTGYSSLYHLRNFKLDRIKIDRSFVAAMTSDPDSAAIVKALIGLGAGLGLDVTAEGVETLEQQHVLVKDGCQLAQGFLFNEALSYEEACALFDTAPAERRSEAPRNIRSS